MKKVYLIVCSVILLSVCCNCQWYNRQYGVNDINQLSGEQLNQALKRAQSGVTGGIILSGAGAAGIVIGAFFIHDTHDPDKPGNIGPALTGLGFLIISIPLEITGLVMLVANSRRVKSIREVLKITELKLGLVNNPCENIYACSSNSRLPCISITVRF